MIRDLIIKNRSYRRFYGDVKIEKDDLHAFVDLARMSPSGANMQPIKYMFVNTQPANASVYECLGWAGYLQDWGGPIAEERPTAYIIVLGDTEIKKGSFDVDYGIAVQSILLGAVEKGFGGCILATVNRKQLRQAISIPDRYEVLVVLALGKPKEEVVLETVGPDGDIKYWRDEKQIHHVPKRSLDELIVG